MTSAELEAIRALMDEVEDDEWDASERLLPTCQDAGRRLVSEVERLRGVESAVGAILAHLDAAVPSAWGLCNECDSRFEALRAALRARP